VKALRISEITQIDSRGRVLIPKSIRETLGLQNGMHVMFIADLEKREIKILPFADPNAKLLEINVTLTDKPGALAKIASTMAKWGVDLLSTQSRTLQRGKSAEWNTIVDVSNCKLRIEELKQKLVKEGEAKNVEIKGFL